MIKITEIGENEKLYYNEKNDDVLKKLGVNLRAGLNSDGVRKSLAKNGKNAISAKKGKSLFSRIVSAVCEPMMLILVFAFVVTFGVNLGKFLKSGDGSFYECIGILIAIAISVCLTVIMEGKSKRAFELLNKISDDGKVKAIRNGKVCFLSREEIVVGDVIMLEAGDKIVADGKLCESVGLKTDESTLTGESSQVKKDASVVLSEATPLGDRINMVFSGTFVVSGNAKYVVTAVGDNAEIGKIAVELTQKAVVSAPLEEKLSRLGKVISIIGLASALFVFTLSFIRLYFLGQVNFENVENIFIEAIVLIVAAVPEGLPSTVAISLSLNVLKLAKSNALIKKLVATETVGSVSVICSDKTGTLTQNKMAVEKVVLKNGETELITLKEKYIAWNVAINSTAEINENGIGSKTEYALLTCLKRGKVDYSSLRQKAEIIDRIPFSSEIKYMSSTARIDGEEVKLIKGAPEVVLKMTNISESKQAEILKAIAKYQTFAKRCIAFAHGLMGGGQSGKLLYDGFAVIDDKLRPDVIEAVSACFTAGIKVKMLTGDNVVTATAVAEKLGIGRGYGKIVTGDEIERMSESELNKAVEHISVVARSSPNVKLRIVRALQKCGEVVAVTGDGVNDAPAVKNADVGIAMGDGSEITKEASDVILLDNSFATIIKAISFGRNIFSNFQRFITFQLTVNLSSMGIIIAFLLMGMESPFSSSCLLWLNVIMDGPLAISLGLEKPNASNLQHKPVKRSENIITMKIIFVIVLHSTIISVIVAMQQLYNFMGVSTLEKSTVTFAMFVLFQLFNAINCREVRSESGFKGLFGNKLLLIVGVLTFILQIIITQFVPSFFSTVPLGVAVWLKIIAICSLILLFAESYKFVYRRVLEFRFKSNLVAEPI